MPNPADESTSITNRAPTLTFTAITTLSGHQTITNEDDQSWSRVNLPARIRTATQAELVQRYTPSIETAAQ
jgi:hypothetical protein